LDEDVAVGQLSVQEALRVALVDVDVTEPGGPEEPTVGDGAGGDEDGQRYERSTQRVPHARRLEARLHAATAAVEAEAARAVARAGTRVGAEAVARAGAARSRFLPSSSGAWPVRWWSSAGSCSPAVSSTRRSTRGSSRTGPA